MSTLGMLLFEKEILPAKCAEGGVLEGCRQGPNDRWRMRHLILRQENVRHTFEVRLPWWGAAREAQKTEKDRRRIREGSKCDQRGIDQ